MLDCVDFDLVRTDHFNVDSVKELFEKVQADSILAYLIDFKIIYLTCFYLPHPAFILLTLVHYHFYLEI